MNFVASGRKWFYGKESKQFDRKRIVNTLRIELGRMTWPENHLGTRSRKLMKYAGRAVGLPEDAALNHDHYLYGAPKR